MKIVTKQIHIKTKADGGMNDLTASVVDILEQSRLHEGIVILFCVGSTCSLSTIEYEPGLMKDFPQAMDLIAPKERDYAHHKTWHDDNGRSHVKAALMGPSLIIPFLESKLTLGSWQHIVLFEWDTSNRARDIVIQIQGK
jgi:secondary thiamine-phosphate synthase enzyme